MARARLSGSLGRLVVLAVVAVAIYVAIRAHRDLTDFAVYRTAAVRAAAAAPLYRVEDGHYQFKYLPAFAVLARPLVWLAPEVAKSAWFVVSFGLLALVIRALVVGLPGRHLAPLTLGVWTVLVLAKFLIRELALGQTNGLLAWLLVPAVVSLRTHPRRAALAAGAAVFVKPYALLVAPWLVLRQPRAAIIGLTTALVAGLLLPVAVYGWAGNLALLADWARTVTDTTSPNLLHPDNVSLAAMWARWLGPGRPAADLALVSGLVLLASVAWMYSRGRDRAEAAYLEGGMLLLLMPLLSPQGWDYVLLLGMPVLVAVIDRWARLSTVERILLGATAIVWATPLRLFVSLETYNAVMATGLVSVSALALVALGVGLRARQLA